VGDIGIQGLYASSCRRLLAMSLVVLVTACSSSTPPGDAAVTASPGPSGAAATASSSPEGQVAAFPVAAFADISADPVTEERAEEFEAAIRETSDRLGGAGIAATVLSPEGSWSGAVGKADSRQAASSDEQFAIGSVTKPLVAAQVMQMVEDGSLGLDDRADLYLPAGLDFDTNGATIRQLMGHRSGIPDYWEEVVATLAQHPQRVWTPEDMLALVPTERTPAGTTHEYADTNYLLLQLVIEQVSKRTVVEVMRDGGVLHVDGIERLVYQPDERPTAPMALPNAMSVDDWKQGRGYLPSIAGTAGPTAGSIATSSLSLAHWWQALCSGKLVSLGSLTTMATFVDGYGLGLTDITAPYAVSFGHPGSNFGFIAWAGCLPDSGSVVVTLSNTGVEDITLPRSLVLAVEAASSTGATP
jgi:D-alanyl-D-alanine carboxypeptidase